MEMTININQFYAKFCENYTFLYDVMDKVAGFNEAVKAFDEFLKENKEFVSEFAEFRGDIIASDREAAAFMFTLEDMGGL